MHKGTLQLLLILLMSCTTASADKIEIPEMILITHGTFIMGDDNLEIPEADISLIPSDSFDEHEVSVGSFYIGSHELTFKDYIQFINKSGYKTKAQKNSIIDDYWSLFTGYQEYPVVFITFREALYYCHWLSKQTGKTFRLPTEAEWEYVASNQGTSKYPWGDTYQKIDKRPHNDAERLNFKKHIFSVLSKEEDKTKSGVYGLYGNAEEYVLDGWDPLYFEKSKEVNPLNAMPLVWLMHVTKGNVGYFLNKDPFGVNNRSSIVQNISSGTTGFRIVREDDQTIFNKDSTYPFVYYQDFFQVVKDTKIYSRPDLYDNVIEEIGKSKKLWVLYRTAEEYSVNDVVDYWYYAYSETNKSGWVFGGDLVTDKPFYEDISP